MMQVVFEFLMLVAHSIAISYPTFLIIELARISLLARVVNSDFRICCKHTTSCSPDMSVFIRHARVRFNKPDKKLQTDRLFINPD